MMPVSFHKITYLKCVEEKSTSKSEFTTNVITYKKYYYNALTRLVISVSVIMSMFSSAESFQRK